MALLLLAHDSGTDRLAESGATSTWSPRNGSGTGQARESRGHNSGLSSSSHLVTEPFAFAHPRA